MSLEVPVESVGIVAGVQSWMKRVPDFLFIQLCTPATVMQQRSYDMVPLTWKVLLLVWSGKGREFC